MPPEPRHLWVYRSLFVVAATVIPLVGLQTWSDTGAYDPMGPRLLFAGSAVAWLTATYTSEFARSWARVALVLLVAAMACFYGYVGHVNEWHTDDALGGVPPFLLVLSLLLRSWRELGLALLAIVALLPPTYLGVEEPLFPLDALLVIDVSLTAVVGALAVGRAGLEDSLDHVNRELESRVHSRTLELRDALSQLKNEVLVRQRAEDTALAASQAKSTFLANMSHELRTPLNAVIGYTEMIQDELHVLEEQELVDDSGRVLAAAQHLLGIIDDLLDLTRIEAEELRVELGIVDLGAVVRHAVELVEPRAHTKGNRIAIDLGDHHVVGDPVRLRQVLVNLLSNAASFTAGGTIHITSRQDGPDTSISVQDNGAGIAPQHLEHVFRPFLQLDDSTTREHSGAGLGLPVSRALVERMRGTLDVHSVLGQGSTFIVCLPTAQPALANAG